MTLLNTGRTLMLAATLALAACDAAEPTSPDQSTPVAVVVVTSPVPTFKVGQHMTLIATPRAANGETLARAVTWQSEHTNLATVDANGVVTARAPGVVNILATSGGRSGSVQLTVVAASATLVAEVRLSVDDVLELDWNGSAQLSAVALDADGNELPGRAVEWLTSTPAVATITGTGLLRAVGHGLAMVSARIEGVSSTAGVRVRPAPVVEVLIDAGATELEVGETVFYGARLKTAAGQIIVGPVVWSSSAPGIVTVTTADLSLGAVSAVSAGPVTLTASAQGVQASIALRVTNVPTHDLVYSKSNGMEAELYVLGFGAGAAPTKLNAGNVSRDPSPSPDGTQIVFAVSQADPIGGEQHDLYVMNRNGMNVRRLTQLAGMESQPVWSPDGTKILFQWTGADHATPNLWVIGVDGSGLTNLTAGLPADVTDKRHPSWSPDGSRMAFIAARNGEHKVWTMNADGSNAAPLMADAGFDATPTWSPDGGMIAFARYNNGAPVNGWDIMLVPAAGGVPVRLALAGDQIAPAWSPDGESIAFAGTAVAGIGVQNIYTVRPDGTGLRLRTANPAWGGGNAPAWIVRQ